MNCQLSRFDPKMLFLVFLFFFDEAYAVATAFRALTFHHYTLFIREFIHCSTAQAFEILLFHVTTSSNFLS